MTLPGAVKMFWSSLHGGMEREIRERKEEKKFV
jgi:hypothetical protein